MQPDVRTRLKRKIASLPFAPGVYVFKGKDLQVLYVGKAKSLPDRLSSYLSSPLSQTLKTQKLAAQVWDVETIVVQTEVEALLLERSLIKTHGPHFNILLRDDKHYPYIKVDLQQDWPRLTVVRRRSHDGATYLGPFSCVESLYRVLNLVHNIFPLVRCSEYEFTHCQRPCNYHSMGQCWAPCHKEVSKEDYHGMIQDVLAFMRGKNKELTKSLRSKMSKAAEDEDFSLAASYRDQLNALQEVAFQEKALNTSLQEADVIAMEMDDQHKRVFVYVLHIRDFLIRGGGFFELHNPFKEEQNQIMHQFLLQYYMRPRELPQVILLSFVLDDFKALSKALYTQCSYKDRGGAKKVAVKCVRLKAEKKAMETCVNNCRLAIQQKLAAQAQQVDFIEQVRKELQLSLSLRHVECMDVSHFSGTGTVASRVVFENGKPNKSLYRCYHIPTDSPTSQHIAGDDYGAIRYVIRRWLAKMDEDNVPDAVVIDGGKGQLMAAVHVQQEEFPHLKIPFFALAKAKNFQYSKAYGRRRRRKSHNQSRPKERLFRYGYKNAVELEYGSSSYRFFTQLRDEAHRFALRHHKKRMQKIRHSSSLENVSGLGTVLRKRLLQRFSSLKNIQAASHEDLASVRGISLAKAKDIKCYLSSKDFSDNVVK
ncbi:MAG: excinuclease ABC subunit UvrC [Proteobacteria bacterium]|nr:excinuclease ABC subunit UvrC [Pseudomonadota bacterium]